MTSASSSGNSLLALPRSGDFIDFPASFGKRFLLTVDTEEEFDWSAPFDRDSRSVTIMKAMAHGQAFFRAAGVKPLYLAGYPVIDSPEAGSLLARWAAAGEAEIGAHCHPWVTPPHKENISVSNSFAGNLPESLEHAKIRALRDRIAEVTGQPPLAFRAGRYGIGPNTGAILRDLGFRVDTSVRSRFSYSGEQGPDFRRFPVTPWRAERLIELPLSTAWAGALGGLGDSLQSVIDRGGLGAGMLARSGLLQRIPLTPEGVTAGKAIRAIDALMEENARLLVFSFHSPSLAPGNTPYVRDMAGLDGFYQWWDIVLAALARRGVEPVSLDEIIAAAS